MKDIQVFLGFANFYRKHIRDYSEIASPLSNLTKKDTKFEWTENTEKVFRVLKQKFIEELILTMFDPDKRTVVETDASDITLGGVISQPDELGRLHLVVFHSRKFSPAELNYDIHDKELLAIVDCFKQWKVYLKGPKHEV